MRLFTGLSLPPHALEPVLALQNELRPLLNLVWTKPEKLHITTKFIGEWPESGARDLQRALSGIALSGPVRVQIRGVFWMSGVLVAGVEMSDDIHLATDAAVATIGVSPEKRPFRPHVTLARGRSRKLPEAALDTAPFLAASFHLYLSANGTYTKLSTYALPD